MRCCIGIVSYLPDDKNIRKRRYAKLCNLLLKCNGLFNLPIIIIGQNYSADEKSAIGSTRNVTLHCFDCRLGIIGARNTLRGVFLASTYDWLIMLDDDIILKGNDGTSYLRQIQANPGCFIEFDKTRLQLFAISREILSKEQFNESLRPEDGGAFEDRLFVSKLRERYPDRRRQFTNTGLREIATATKDSDSTWYSGQDIQGMRERTLKMIESKEF